MWDKITVEQFQQIHLVHKEQKDETDKMLALIGIVFNLTERQIDDLPILKYHKLVAEITALAEKQPEREPSKVIKAGKRKYLIQYDIAKMRYAQWTEIQFFFNEGDFIQNVHLLAASISHPIRFGFLIGKNKSEQHQERANDFLQANYLETYNSLVFFCAEIKKFKRSYPGIFEINDDRNEIDEDEVVEDRDPFESRYGWILSATKIKEHEGITLDQAFELSVQQAFNDLSYLKAFGNKQKELNKKQHAVNIE